MRCLSILQFGISFSTHVFMLLLFEDRGNKIFVEEFFCRIFMKAPNQSEGGKEGHSMLTIRVMAKPLGRFRHVLIL